MLEVIVYDTHQGFLVERASGRLVYPELRNAVEARAADPEFENVRWVVTDQRDIRDFDLDVSEIRALALKLQEQEHHYHETRWGALVHSPRATAMTLLFEELVGGHLEFRTFTSVEGLLAWIGGPPELAASLAP